MTNRITLCLITTLIIGIASFVPQIITASAFAKEEKTTRKQYLEHIHNGRKYLYEKNYNKAIEEFEQATQINPNSADSYMCIGDAYLGLNQNEDAAKNYEKAIQIDSTQLRALNNLGICYCR